MSKAQNLFPRHKHNPLTPRVEMTLAKLFGRWQKVASLSLEATTCGHGVKLVSELLGHSVAITLRTYDHVASDAFRVPLNEAAGQLL